jgi:Gene product 88
MKEPVERRPMLTLGNGHLGPLIYSFSLPAFSTCPGATLACLTVCYALQFLFAVKTNLAKHQAHWDRAESAPAPFVKDLSAEIRWKRVQILRVHVAGDFFAVAYIRAWITIAKTCKRVKFLFYTRSWRVPELRPLLTELASLPNVYAFWSEDRDTGPCDLAVGRRCYLCIAAEDEALVPPGVLVFREDTKVPRKWINGSWVCPKEQGTGANITCSACRRCVISDPFPTPPEWRERVGISLQ